MRSAALIMAILMVTVSVAGCGEKEQSEWSLVGYTIQIPVKYTTEYKSYDLGGSTERHREEINIHAIVDPSAIKARPVYVSDFADMAKTWIGQRIPRLNNQEGISDDYKRLENTEPKEDEEFVSADQVIDTSGTGDGYTIYTGGKWDLSFLDEDGMVAYEKTFRNAVLLRVPSHEMGVHRTEHVVLISVYVPKWKLPDTQELECRLDWELQGLRVEHNWEFGDLWNEYAGNGEYLVRDAIDRGHSRIDGYISGLGTFFMEVGIVLLATAAIVAFPVSIAVAVGLLTAAAVLTVIVLIQNSNGDIEEVPAVEQKGYQTPQLVMGSGFVTFTIILESEHETVAAIIRPETEMIK